MNIILLGPPGAGKGTQAKILSKRLNIEHISTGDLLRKNVREDTELGKKAKEYMEKGLLVPDELVNAMLKEKFNQIDLNKGFVLDGYPRNINQAEELDKILLELNARLDKVIYLDVDKEVILERLTGRLVCANCGANFHIKNMPPKEKGICNFCGGKLVQRSDDNKETIEERLRVYKEEIQPLLDFYRKKGLVISVDASKEASLLLEEIIKIINDSYKERRRNFSYA